MADESTDGQDKTEDPTEERREQFRERGEVAFSREMSSVLVLAAVLTFLSLYAELGFRQLKGLLISEFEGVHAPTMGPRDVMAHLRLMWMAFLKLTVPIFIVTLVVASFTTLAQTRLNFSWERVKPTWSKISLLAGLKRMVSGQAVAELVKGIGKMMAVGTVAYLILFSEWRRLPGLIHLGLGPSWAYWAVISRQLFWCVLGLLLLIAGGDYLYQFLSLERRMRMSKQELKDDYKQREADPLVKNRMRRMQRELANRKTVEATKKATVLITNPTHYAIALRYEVGMPAPILVAKGVDFMALRMREVATAAGIPLVENKPLARTLYKVTEVDEEIPESLYKTVSEVIRYVFRLKGVKVGGSA